MNLKLKTLVFLPHPTPSPQPLVDTTWAANTAVPVEVWRRKYGTIELAILSAHVEFFEDGAYETFLW